MVDLLQQSNSATAQTEAENSTSPDQRYQELEEALARKEAELAWYQNLLSMVADTVSGKVAYIDTQKRYRFASQRFQEWYGIAPQDLIGKTIEELMGKTDYQVIQPNIEAGLSGKRVSYKYTGFLPDGKERFLRVNYVPDIRESGEVLGLVIVIEDLTEFK